MCLHSVTLSLRVKTHGHTHTTKVEKQTAVSCQATQPDLSSVAALISVLHTTDMSRAFNFPLKCPGTTEGWGGSVWRWVSPSVDVDSLITLCDSFWLCACVFLLSSTYMSVYVCQDVVTLVHIIADDGGCSSRPTININSQEQVDWELSYQGRPS